MILRAWHEWVLNNAEPELQPNTRPKFSKCFHLRNFDQPQQTEGKGKKKNVGPKPFCLAKLARIDLSFVQF
jgi:hypothetical protein